MSTTSVVRQAPLGDQSSPAAPRPVSGVAATIPQLPADRRRASLKYHAALLAIAASVIAVASLLQINEQGQVATPWGGESEGMPPLCVYRRLFQMDCPGCGLTRCFVSAAHGNLRQAWSFHPVGLLLFGVAVAQIPWRAWQIGRVLRGKEEIAAHSWAPWLAGTLGALLIGQWIVRLLTG